MGAANTGAQSLENQAGIASNPVAVGRNVSRIRKTSVSVMKLLACSIAVCLESVTVGRDCRVVVVHNSITVIIITTNLYSAFL